MIDFSIIEKDFKIYWLTHNKTKAVESLTKIYNYFNDFTLLSPSLNLEYQNLSALYSTQNYMNIQDAVNNVSYETMIEWYKSYLYDLINEIQDNQKKLKALEEKGIFDNILNQVSETIKQVANYSIYFLILFIILFSLYLFYRLKL